MYSRNDLFLSPTTMAPKRTRKKTKKAKDDEEAAAVKLAETFMSAQKPKRGPGRPRKVQNLDDQALGQVPEFEVPAVAQRKARAKDQPVTPARRSVSWESPI